MWQSICSSDSCFLHYTAMGSTFDAVAVASNEERGESPLPSCAVLQQCRPITATILSVSSIIPCNPEDCKIWHGLSPPVKL
ncbi:unnamed protein product [Ixodes pacificus]